MLLQIKDLVPYEETLRELLPNIQMTVEGEVSIFDKMQPFLSQALNFLEGNFEISACAILPADKVRDVLVVRAFREAAPSLDCVLTPNGFAVVFNEHMMPSAKIQGKKPLDRMLESLAEREFNLSVELVSALLLDEGWAKTSTAAVFGGTLFTPSQMVASFALTQIADFYSIRPQLDFVQNKMIRESISQEVFDSLCSALRGQSLTVAQGWVIRLLRKAITSYIGTVQYDADAVDMAVDIIRKNPNDFPTWADSPQGKIYLAPPDYSNDKNASGYFF